MDRGYQPASVHAIQPGERMTFGLYPQSADGEVRPIVWRVLQNMGSELFLLSEEILECKRYHGKNADISWRDAVDTTWRDCDLRQWLNEEFYATAFGADEQKMIMTTHCGDNGEGSPDTEDKVFLLSVTEIKALTAVLGKAWLTAVGTDYAKLKKPDAAASTYTIRMRRTIMSCGTARKRAVPGGGCARRATSLRAPISSVRGAASAAMPMSVWRVTACGLRSG